MKYVEEHRRSAKDICVHFAAVAGRAINPWGRGRGRLCASSSRESRPLLKKYDLRKTRMFFYGPFALAVFLGQQLTSVGEIQLFEYQDPGYVPSCSLRT